MCPSIAEIGRTARSRSLGLSAIRPISAVEHLLFPPFQAPLALRLSRALEQTPPFGRLRFAWFLARIIAYAISALKNGSSTAEIYGFQRMFLIQYSPGEIYIIFWRQLQED